jgi:hypothetical protein
MDGRVEIFLDNNIAFDSVCECILLVLIMAIEIVAGVDRTQGTMCCIVWINGCGVILRGYS